MTQGAGRLIPESMVATRWLPTMLDVQCLSGKLDTSSRLNDGNAARFRLFPRSQQDNPLLRRRFLDATTWRSQHLHPLSRTVAGDCGNYPRSPKIDENAATKCFRCWNTRGQREPVSFKSDGDANAAVQDNNDLKRNRNVTVDVRRC